jgi:hypothetical protein
MSAGSGKPTALAAATLMAALTQLLRLQTQRLALVSARILAQGQTQRLGMGLALRQKW